MSGSGSTGNCPRSQALALQKAQAIVGGGVRSAERSASPEVTGHPALARAYEVEHSIWQDAPVGPPRSPLV